MRTVLICASAMLLCACASTSLAPREYLDEQTTATITVAAQPLIFVAQNSAPITRDSERNRDYVELYGLDVNRMGTHRQFIAVLQWIPAEDLAGTVPTLELGMGPDTLQLQPTSESAKDLGIAQPLAPAYSGGSHWWYYPADPATLRRIAAAHELNVTLAFAERRASYEMFSDGRAQLAELTAVLP